MPFPVTLEDAALVEQPLGGRAYEPDERRARDLAVEPRVHANDRRGRKPVDSLEERLRDHVLRQHPDQVLGLCGDNKVRRFQLAAVAQADALHDSATINLEPLHDRTWGNDAPRSLDEAARCTAIQFAQTDSRIDEGGIRAP